MNQISTPAKFRTEPQGAIRRLKDHLARHGDSLDRMLRQVRADPDLNESHEIVALISSEPDPARVSRRLKALVRELLICLGEPIVDINRSYVGPEFDAGLCWHAMRLHDLERDIRRLPK